MAKCPSLDDRQRKTYMNKAELLETQAPKRPSAGL